MFRALYDEKGREIPDPTPMSLPAGWDRPESLTDQIKRLIRVQMSREAFDAGHESFEEADDFEVDEDPDPVSAYEVRELVPEPLQGAELESMGGGSGAPQKTAPEPSTGLPGASEPGNVAPGG